MPTFFKEFEKMRAEISDLKSEINSLSTEIKSKSLLPEYTKPYADILKSGSAKIEETNLNVHFPTLIIKPKQKQNSEKSKKDIQSKINPTEISK